MAPVAVIVLMTAVVISSLLLWSTRNVDEASLERQRALVNLVLAQSVDRVAYDQESSTVWDDSVEEVRRRPVDLEWLDNNLGLWFHSYYGHDATHILDPQNRPIYAMQAGRRVSPDAFEAITPQVMPLVRDVRGSSTPQQPRALEVAMLSPGAADVVVVNGRPAIVSVKPIVSDSGEIVQKPGSEHLHVSVRYLDGSFVQRLRQQYLFEGSRFAWTDDRRANESSVPLVGRTGTVGYVIWRPFAPGGAVLGDLRFALLAGLAVLALVVALLMQRLRRRTLDLQFSEAQAQHLALHDVLTGLPNRALFEDRLEQGLASMRRDAPPLALLYLDLDRFKQVNDTLGHPAGDELIREVARRLTHAVRDSDTVARMGGDEFAIVQRNIQRPAEVELLCMRIVEAMAQPIELSSGQAHVGISIGVAIGGKHGDDPVELARKADIALYVAKKSGRGRYTFFAEEMDAFVQERQTLERELRVAIATGEEFELVYQPTYSAQSGRMSGVEALLRWIHPEKGMLLPATFVPLAEETGLIEPLGEWVLETACRTARDWRIERLAVNVSPGQLRNPLFADVVRAILSRTGFDPRTLELELTETCFLDRPEEYRPNIEALRALGVQIALDDFGTGYSSLTHLRDLDVDRIKIDSSFVAAIVPGAGGSAIIRAIVDLARAVGLGVTAEGVETPEQHQFLSSVGCDELQGFLMARPMTARQVSKLLQAA
jgi:diguanylate cyclase (GGDEF)-like protein